MTRNDWFIVQNSIIDRDDLTIYEKMCCVVLARYAGKEEFDDLLTSDIIAIKMGVDSSIAKKAVFGLIEKGLINFEGKTRQELDEEIYHEEVKINTILEEANNEKILKNEESSPKLSMSEFKKRLNAINAVKDDEVENVFEEENKNIVRSKEVDDTKSSNFEFANLNFEDMFSEEEHEKARAKSEELDHEFEKTLINDEWANELEKVEEIIQNSNLDDNSVYSSLSEEAKYHLGMLENQNEASMTINKTNVEPTKRLQKNVSKSKDHYHTLVDQVYEILDEQINEREARIILSFADNDIEKIREKYKVAKRSQINDKIEVLINELQKKDKIAVDSSSATIISEEEMENLPNTQINMANINKMKAYSKYSKKK